MKGATKLEEDVQRHATMAVLAGDGDPEVSHGHLDAMLELVAKAAAASQVGSREAAMIAVRTLDTRDREGWRRWYA